VTRPLAALIAVYLVTESRLPLHAVAPALLVCLLAAHTSARLRWLILSITLGAEIIATTWQAPNHLFVLLYMALIATIHHDAPADTSRAARALFVVIMGMATLQKLISPRYMSGEYFLYMTLRGALARYAAHHRDALAAWLSTYPDAPLPITRSPAPLMAARLLAWSAVAAEAALTALAWRARDAHTQRHLAIAALLFLPALILIRPELLFAATLAALTRWCVHDQPGRLRTALDLATAALVALAALAAWR
jgi:hypothetical protein